MELKDIYELWDRFDTSATDEMELDLQGVHLRLKKQSVQSVSLIKPCAPLPETIKAEEKAAGQSQEQTKKTSDKVVEIKAPLVGTFYQSPSPEETAFVKAGQQVHKGDVVGLIEAMKLMNEVIAPSDGIVLEILAEDSNLVEYGQVLMMISAEEADV